MVLVSKTCPNFLECLKCAQERQCLSNVLNNSMSYFLPSFQIRGSTPIFYLYTAISNSDFLLEPLLSFLRFAESNKWRILEYKWNPGKSRSSEPLLARNCGIQVTIKMSPFSVLCDTGWASPDKTGISLGYPSNPSPNQWSDRAAPVTTAVSTTSSDALKRTHTTNLLHEGLAAADVKWRRVHHPMLNPKLHH